MEKLRQYSSKILLFGEYAIIHGSPALAIPYNGYEGGFKMEEEQYDLKSFYSYLKSLNIPETIMDTALMEQDSKNGLRFVSNIPFGYGLGSSGALTAAVFDRYLSKKKLYTIKELKEIFANIESYFHGESSGIDPLVSYLNVPILITGQKEIELIDPPKNEFHFYLVDTGKERSTQILVEKYLEKYQQKPFQSTVDKLISLNKTAIQAYLINDESLFNTFKEISELQQDAFKEMIPLDISQRVKQYHLKLCGAGGGGYFLGIARKADLPRIQKEMEIVII